MALKDILVHVDNLPSCERRIDAAVALATRHQAHLTGLFVRTFPRMPQFVRAQFGPELIALQQRYADEAAAQAQALFERKVAGAGVNHGWRTDQSDPFEVVALHARYADLTVVGQQDPEGDEELPLADHLVFDTGRPVIVVPYEGTFTAPFKTIVVAWNGSREATRAVNDALPLLKQAEKVTVVAVNPVGGSTGHGEVPGADICLHLARHGVKAEAQTRSGDDVGVELTACVADENADLLVMGAYGRSRVREVVLGGATRYVLDHTVVPVLMSH